MNQSAKAIQRVFVVGASHSGTSILERTIGNMIGVMCIGFESNLFDGADTAANITAQLTKWDTFASDGGYTHWVEKTPAHICHLRDIFTISPTAKVVWIHREPHKVAHSLLARNTSFKNITRALNFWADSNRCVLDMLPNPNILEVTHRDFTSMDRVYSVLANISVFLGLAQNAHDPLVLLGPASAERCHPVTCQRYANDTVKREDLRTALLRTLVGDRKIRHRASDRHSARRSWQLCQPWYGDRYERQVLTWNFSHMQRPIDIIQRLYPNLRDSSRDKTSSVEGSQTAWLAARRNRGQRGRYQGSTRGARRKPRADAEGPRDAKQRPVQTRKSE